MVVVEEAGGVGERKETGVAVVGTAMPAAAGEAAGGAGATPGVLYGEVQRGWWVGLGFGVRVCAWGVPCYWTGVRSQLAGVTFNDKSATEFVRNM